MAIKNHCRGTTTQLSARCNISTNRKAMLPIIRSLYNVIQRLCIGRASSTSGKVRKEHREKTPKYNCFPLWYSIYSQTQASQSALQRCSVNSRYMPKLHKQISLHGPYWSLLLVTKCCNTELTAIKSESASANKAFP